MKCPQNMVKYVALKGSCWLEVGPCQLPLQRLNHDHYKCWPSSPPWKVFRVETKSKALCALGKIQKNSPLDSQMFSGKDNYESKFLHLLIPRETLMSWTNLDLVLLASPTKTFLLLLIFGPCIFKFLVKFVSPSSNTTRVSPGQHPDSARASCLIILWTLISLRKCTPRSSGYSPFEILYGRPPPVIEKLKGDHQQLADLELSQHLQALGTVFRHIILETWESTPIPLGNWVHPYQPGD